MQTSAYNAAGEDVWDSDASKITSGSPSCFGAAVPGPGPTWPALSSSTLELDWSQYKCAENKTGQPGHANPNCPGTQVPAGTYRIVDGTSASATFTISARPHA
jgi:hypothetical protein